MLKIIVYGVGFLFIIYGLTGAFILAERSLQKNNEFIEKTIVNENIRAENENL